MSLAIQHPAPPIVVTLVLHPGHPDRPAEVLPAAASVAPVHVLTPVRPTEPEDEPTWEDAAWY